MVYKLSKSKRIQAVIVLAIAALLVMTGTFAWYSFNQRKVNVFNLASAPNVNLHDDFAGGPEKDVYVENSGVQPALVRVRLAELLNQDGVILPDGAADDEVGTGWHVHTPSEVCEVCDFAAHEYFKWTMDGHKFYMPAAESAKGFKIDDDTHTEPKDVGDLDAVIDYAALLRAAFAGDSLLLSYIDEYLGGNASHAAELQAAIKEIPNDNTVSGVRQYDGQPEEELVRKLNEVRLTLIPTPIITMQDWIDGTTYSEPYKTGDFWVTDADGWCYWANALNMGETTGQLLSNVGNIKQTSGELIYKINVVLNATTFANTELNDFFLTAKTNGGISEDGMFLMFMASGDYVMGEDGELYKNDGGGAYRKVEKNSGSYIDYSLGAAIYAGTDGLIGTADDSTVSPEDTERRYYHHIGNGVYIEVADETGAEPKYEPLTYYFSSEIFEDAPFIIDNLDGHSIDAKVEAIFSFSLYIGEQFGVLDDKETGFSAILKGQEMQDAKTDGKIQSIFTMIELYELDEQLYINLTEHYANLYLGGTGANGEFGGSYAGELAEVDEMSGKMKPAVVPNRPDGEGSQGEPFLIKSRTEMNWLTRELMHGNTLEGKYLEVVQSFSMGETDFLPIGSATNQFIGTFDGGGFTISDLKATSSGNYVGLFGYVGEGSVVKNLTLANVDIKSTISVGAIAGFSLGTVENCHVLSGILESTNTGTESRIGGVVGTNHTGTGVVIDCTNRATIVSAGGRTGGVVGSNQNTIIRCQNFAPVTGAINTGGIAGNSTGTVTDCINSGNVTGSFGNVGGVVGISNGGSISNSFNSGDVTCTGNSGTGGVAGNSSGEIVDCGNSGTVSSDNSNVGGVVGNNSGTVQKSYSNATGKIQGNMNNVGGVTGSNSGNVQYCYAWGDVTSAQSGAGGVSGGNSGSIQYCYAWGNITSAQNGAGGVVGVTSVESVISNVYHANGTITCVIDNVNHFAAGISGFNQGSVTNAYALANSIAGTRRGTVTAAYGTIINSYHVYTDTGSGYNNVNGTYRTKPANLSGWSSVIPDFGNASIWRWDSANGLPVLVGVTP